MCSYRVPTLVPRGINLAQMLALCPGTYPLLRTSETDLDWSKVFIEVNISNRDTGESMQLIQPVDGSVTPMFFDKRMENFDTVIIRVRRQPNFFRLCQSLFPCCWNGIKYAVALSHNKGFVKWLL